MKRTIINYCIDISLLVGAVFCGTTGIIKWPGLIASLGLSYKTLSIAAITGIHDWSGLLIVILAVLHVLMHRKWLVVLTRQIFLQSETGT